MFGSILHGFILHEVCLGCVVGGVNCETIAADPGPRTTGTGFFTMHNQGTNNSHNGAQITITMLHKSQSQCCTNNNYNVTQITMHCVAQITMHSGAKVLQSTSGVTAIAVTAVINKLCVRREEGGGSLFIRSTLPPLISDHN